MADTDSEGAKGGAVPKYSPAIVKCWQMLGYPWWNEDYVKLYPWGGRSSLIARMRVFEKYIEPDDVLAAVWIHLRSKNSDPEWSRKEAGACHIGGLMRERSGGGWHEEAARLAEELPSVLGYMEQVWGEGTRAAMAEHRRAQFRVVEDDDACEERADWPRG
jgi:hypothetical protein